MVLATTQYASHVERERERCTHIYYFMFRTLKWHISQVHSAAIEFETLEEICLLGFLVAKMQLKKVMCQNLHYNMKKNHCRINQSMTHSMIDAPIYHKKSLSLTQNDCCIHIGHDYAQSNLETSFWHSKCQTIQPHSMYYGSQISPTMMKSFLQISSMLIPFLN